MSEAPGAARPVTRQIRDRSTFVLIILATFGLQALTLVTGVIIARVLGVEGRGIVALIFALGLLASQISFGGSPPVALAKNLAERGIRARDGLRDVARRRGALLALPSLVAAGFFLYLQRAEPGGEKYVFTAAVFVMALQTMVFRILGGCLQGEGHLVRMSLAALMPQFLFTVALSTAWIADWGWDALDMLLAYFIACFLGLAYAFASLSRPTRRSEDRLDEGELWTESRRSYLSSVRPLDGLGLDRIVVGGVMGTVSLGLYAAAAAVSNLCSLVSNAVSVVVLPRVAMHHADPAAQRAVIRRWVGVAAALIVSMVVLLELAVDPIIRLAFGEEFVGAIECARWLILADGLMAMRKVLIAVLQGQGRGGTASWIELSLLPVMVGCVTAAAVAGSLAGVGIGLSVAGLLACVALGWAVSRPVRTGAVDG